MSVDSDDVVIWFIVGNLLYRCGLSYVVFWRCWTGFKFRINFHP